MTLRVIKAAQRLGFTLGDVADLIEVGRGRGRDTGLQARAVDRLTEVEAKISGEPISVASDVLGKPATAH